MFIRRNRRRSGPADDRVLAWQIGVFFLAAGVWLAGVIADDTRITGAAIALLLLAVLLRLLRDGAASDDAADGSEQED